MLTPEAPLRLRLDADQKFPGEMMKTLGQEEQSTQAKEGAAEPLGAEEHGLALFFPESPGMHGVDPKAPALPDHLPTGIAARDSRAHPHREDEWFDHEGDTGSRRHGASLLVVAHLAGRGPLVPRIEPRENLPDDGEGGIDRDLFFNYHDGDPGSTDLA